MLTETQKQRLQSIHSYEWADDDPMVSRSKLESLYDAIESTIELWFSSFIIQLEPERGDFELVLNHKKCDRGIALLLYWSLDPCSLYAKAARQIVKSDARWSVMKMIEERLLDGTYSQCKIAFDPSIFTGRASEQDLARVPRQLTEPTTGEECALDYRQAVFD